MYVHPFCGVLQIFESEIPLFSRSAVNTSAAALAALQRRTSFLFTAISSATSNITNDSSCAHSSHSMSEPTAGITPHSLQKSHASSASSNSPAALVLDLTDSTFHITAPTENTVQHAGSHHHTYSDAMLQSMLKLSESLTTSLTHITDDTDMDGYALEPSHSSGTDPISTACFSAWSKSVATWADYHCTATLSVHRDNVTALCINRAGTCTWDCFLNYCLHV